METGATVAGQATVGRSARWERVTSLARRQVAPALTGSVLPFALVFYLALKGGGYDEIVRSEVGIAVWWVVLIGALAGVLPRARISRTAWVALGLLTAFTVWTAIGIGWSESSEQSAAELARVATYLGVFVLALFSQGQDGLRRTANAVALAIALVGGLALLSRLQPEWFPSDQTARFLPYERERLNYPLNYWNGLAALMAIGLPLVLAAAVQARRLALQALATAALPIMALTGYYTFSRGGAGEVAIGLLAFLALWPRRVAALPSLALAAGGSALLIAAAEQRSALADGLLFEAAARSEGGEMLAVVLVVCAGVALLRAAVGLAARNGLGPHVSVSARSTRRAVAGVAIAGVAAAIAAGVPGAMADRWEEFKQPVGAGAGGERFLSAAGNQRYQYWQSMVDANATDPLTGIGPGNFEYWWAHEGPETGHGFVRDAHSLYFETLGELGIVGLALMGGLIAWVLGVGIARTVRAGPGRRDLLAAATAACVAFAVAAGIDWAWELTVLPVAFLLLAATLVAHSRASDPEESKARLPVLARWLGVPGLAVTSVVVIAIPMAATALVRDSEKEMHSDLSSALDKARAAESLQPYAASPNLQEALVLEAQGDLDEAALAARDATEKEPANWRTWYVLSRVAGESRRPREAARAYREARSLNPRSPLFASPDPPPLSTPE